MQHKGRPPVAPTAHMVASDSDEEESKDQVPHMANIPLPVLPSKRGKSYAPVDWQDYYDRLEFAQEVWPIYWAGTTGPIFVVLHGAGHTGLSFALVAKEMKAHGCRVAAPDFRAHGLNRITEEEYKLDIEQMLTDTLAILNYVRLQNPQEHVVLVGHSMGGAIASKAGLRCQQQGTVNLSGVIVLDVVEGSALENLQFMDSVIEQRPNHFRTIEAAVEWAVRTNSVKNLESAKVSLPSQVRLRNPANPAEGYEWRTDLRKTKPFWEGWFRGMSRDFLATHCQKQLIVAGSDRVDREMMIAQMQGKYKHTILHGVGHVVQEDNPGEIARQLLEFVHTFRLA